MTLGNSLLWISTVATVVAIAAYAPGIRRNTAGGGVALARLGVYVAAAGLLATCFYLWSLILGHRFQFGYVYRYSSLDMPLRYLITSLWGGQEGTLLLWATYGSLLAVFLRFKARQYEAAVQFFFMGITLFLLMMLLKRSPFVLLDGVPADGNGLNPLLQDPWMTIHPPIMFFGFASMGVPAAFAMAALVREDWDDWVPRSLPWALFGVMALGTGLTLGGYWSYSILGWGGYWGWDPVENSSLVPWLFGVTLVHNLTVQRKNGRFRRINLLLAMLPFIFLTYSTFLTRSGVLADFSVHSFTDLGINQFLVAFMAVFIGGGVLLYLLKVRRIPVIQPVAPLLTRENVMFWGASSFALFAVLVALGTSAPLLTRLWGPSSNVTASFYNTVGLPFVVITCLLLAVAPQLLWSRSGPSTWYRSLLLPGALAVVSVPVYYWGGVHWGPYLLVMGAATFAALSNLEVARVAARRRMIGVGGILAHVGVGCMLLGIVTSTSYSRTEQLQLPKGRDVPSLGCTLRYTGNHPVENGRKTAYDVVVSRNGRSWTLSPTMYYSAFNGAMMKKPAIRSFLSHDLYMAPGGVESQGIDERITSRVVLIQNEPRRTKGTVFTFLGFTPGGAAGPTTHIRVGEGSAATEIGVPWPGPGAATDPSNVAVVPGGPSLALDSLDVVNNRIRIAVRQSPLILSPGQSGRAGSLAIRFDGFETDMGPGDGKQVVVHAHTQVDFGGRSYPLQPGIIVRNGQREFAEAPIGDTGMNLVLADANAGTHQATFYVAAPPGEVLWVEFSRKPFIVLLWMGTGLVISGLVLSTVTRARIAGRLAAGRRRKVEPASEAEAA